MSCSFATSLIWSLANSKCWPRDWLPADLASISYINSYSIYE